MFVGCFAINCCENNDCFGQFDGVHCMLALSPNIDVIKHVCGYKNFLPSLNMFNTSFGNGKTFLL